MSDMWLTPGVAHGQVDAPPSKSYTHRGLLIASMTPKEFRLVRPLDSEDTRRTAAGVRALGYSVRHSAAEWTVTPRKGGRSIPRGRIDCGSSGTTLRFLIGRAAREVAAFQFVGSARLARRPLQPLLKVLAAAGASVRRPPVPRTLPLTIRGPIRAGSYRLRADESSQFLSSLLLVLPTLAGNSRVRILGRPVSRPYVDATVTALRAQGVEVDVRDRSALIPGGQSYRGSPFVVPGDASSAAYLWAAAAITGGRTEVRRIDARWPQADLAILPILQRAGARVRRRGQATTVSGRLERPLQVDLTDTPDLYPLCGAIAANIPGTSRLRGGAQVRGKESDRVLETARLARGLGARVRARGSVLEVTGSTRPSTFRGRLPDDHRLVMSAAVGSMSGNRPARIGPAESVAKSYPGFWDDLSSLNLVLRRAP